MKMSDEHDGHPEPEEGFVSRWSRRKREADEAEGRVEQPGAPDIVPQAAPEIAESRPVELTDADMPPLESLDEHSDYRGFLSPKVSEGLRRAALRKLFGLSRFNACDGLDDYAQDFTRFEPLGDLMTHEMRRVLAREGEKLAAALGQEDASGQTDQAPRLVAADQGSGAPGVDPPLESVDGDAEEPASATLPHGSKE